MVLNIRESVAFKKNVQHPLFDHFFMNAHLYSEAKHLPREIATMQIRVFFLLFGCKTLNVFLRGLRISLMTLFSVNDNEFESGFDYVYNIKQVVA